MWLPSLSTCKNLHISLEIIPTPESENDTISIENNFQSPKSAFHDERFIKIKMDNHCKNPKCSSIILFQKDLAKNMHKKGLFTFLLKLERDKIIAQLIGHKPEDLMELKVYSPHLYDGEWHQIDFFVDEMVCMV